MEESQESGMEGRSGSESPDVMWIHRPHMSPPPINATPQDFLLETVHDSPAPCAPDCLCGPGCRHECCAGRREVPKSRPPGGRGSGSISGGSSDNSDEHTPLLVARAEPTDPAVMPESVSCACHVKQPDKTSTMARNKLIIACILALFFMIGEVVGGYLAHSLAILTDAAHMLSDFASFLISLFAIWVATRKPSKGMSFGWHRAEVLGAVISVLIIWVVTGVLVYEAIQRCIHQDFEIDADVMLITACGGVFVNVFMMVVLHQHGHGHSHGGGGGHSHGGAGQRRQEGEEGEGRGGVNNKKGVHNKNINVHAAFIHVVGDLIQSIGIVIAGYIIWFKPEWKLADPICTFLFSILVLFTTINILKDTLRVLMEGTPKHIDYEAVKADLVGMQGVKHAHSLQIWSLTLNKTALAVHLALEPGADNQDVLEKASCMLKEKYGIHQTTLQVEAYEPTMDECHTCQNVRTPNRVSSFFKLSRNSSPNGDIPSNTEAA